MRPSTSRIFLLTSVAVTAIGTGTVAGPAFAAPSGGQITAGSASISQSGSKTDIHQNSGKVVLDWRSFDIGASEHVEFHQPSSSAMALNRIRDVKASQIDGKLTANGHVMLINPNGIVFGRGAQVDVGSLTATTADIDNDDFMAGRLDFKHAGLSDAAIINHGTISIKEAGLASFVAPRVENHGVIAARLGKVQLAAGDTFALDMAGDGLLQVRVTDEQAQKLALNTGRITAEGGTIALTAGKARNLFDSLVKNTGTIEAHSMTRQGGKVILSGSHTTVSGTVNANGKTGGGEILIGGDYQGKGDLQTAQMTDITETAQISADALDQGDGGKVIIWADQNTRFAGSITAHGGVNGGDGGFVETSGKQNLLIETGSSVNASALHHDGKAGDWLLDPSNVTITDGGANSIPGTGGTFDPTTDDYYIDAASISAALNNGNNVTITTTANGGADGEVGNITITNATIEKNVNNNDVTLTFYAHNDISISDSSITSSENALNLVLNADRDATEEGKISITNSTITTNGGFFVAGGGDGDLGGANGILGDGDGTGADDQFAYAVGSGDGVSIEYSDITTSNGDIIIHGYAKGAGTRHGSFFYNSLLSSGDGNITIVGTSTGDTDFPNGIGIIGHTPSSIGTIQSTGGNISLIGTATTSGRPGINLYEDTSITTVDGDIELTAISTSNYDIWTGGSSPNQTIESANGNITLNMDSARLNSITSIHAGNNLNIYTNDPTTTIGLGNGASGTLNLGDDELAILSAGNKIVIGKDNFLRSNMDINSWDLSGTDFDVELYANDIYMGGITMGEGDILARARDNSTDLAWIKIDGDISRDEAGTSTLDLRADWDVIIESAEIESETGSINIVLNADRDGDEDGRVTITDSAITTNGGFFVAGGGDGDLGGANGILGDGDGTGADDQFAYAVGSGDGVSIEYSDITTSNGDIIIHGNAKGTGTDDGITFEAITLSSDNGKISLTGVSTGDVSNPKGIGIDGGDSSVSISATGGDIDITATTVNSQGFYMWDTASITTTDGDITITATSSYSTDISAGGSPSSRTISSANGNITINANSVRFDDIASISAGDTLSIFSINPATSIALGGGSGALGLNATELSILNAGNKIVIGKDGVQTGDIDLDVWNMNGKSYDVELYGNDITMGGITMGTGSILAHAQDNGGDTGDLRVDGNISRNADGVATLDLRADDRIIITSANITAYDSDSDGDNNAATDADSLNVILNADRDADESGRIAATTSNITTLGGYVVVGGGSGDIGGANGILGDGDGTGADDIAAFTDGSGDAIYWDTINVTTSGGDIIIKGNAKGAGAADGLKLYLSSLSSGNGRISLTGTSTGDAGTPKGISLQAHSSGPVTITTTGGDIDITGNSSNEEGLYLSRETTVTTIDGNINITATSAASTDIGSSGTDADHTFTSTNGNITINADDVDFSDFTSISAGDTLSIFTIDPTTTIGLGGGTGTFNLSTTELSKLNAGNKIIIGKNGIQDGDIDIDTWNISGRSFDLEFYGNDIHLGGIDMGEGSILAHARAITGDAGQISVNGTITRNANGEATLDLRADQGIFIVADILASDNDNDSDGDPITDADQLNIILNADRNGAEAGVININASTITTNGGYFVAGGGSGDIGGTNGILGDGDGTGADDKAAFAAGSGNAVDIVTSSITTSGGTIIINGNSKGAGSERAIRLGNSQLSSGNGNIKLTGISTGDTNHPIGINFSGSDANPTTVSSTGGNIDIYASATNSSATNFWEDTSVTTEDGDITITAISSASNGLWFDGSTPDHTISSTNGNITLNVDIAAIQNATAISAGDTLSIFTIDPTTTIGLGGGTGTLNLSTIELGKLNAGNKIVIGKDGVQQGDMDVNAWNLGGTTFDTELYGQDTTIGGITMGEGSILAYARDNGGDNGDLVIDGDITRTANGVATLDLRADGGIGSSVAVNITANDADSDGDGDPTTDADSLNIIFNANREGVVGNEEGGLSIHNATIRTLGGNVIMGGGTDPQNTPTYRYQGVRLSNTSIDSGAGNIYMTGTSSAASGGTGWTGIWFTNDSSLTTTTGDIRLTGISRTDGTENPGIHLETGSISTTSGEISITGEAQGNNTDNNGVTIAGNFDITSTGTGTGIGDITITGTGPGDQASAILIDGSGSIDVKDANVTLTGVNGNITLDNAISKTGGNEEITITIQADEDISLTNGGDITSSSGIMNVILNSDRDGDEEGKISLSQTTITTLGGYFVAGGGSGTLGGVDGILGNGDGTGADDSFAYAFGSGSGIYISDSQITTAGGKALLHGNAKGAGTAWGTFFLRSSINTGNGDVSITGVSTGDSNYPRGIEFSGGDSTPTTITTTGGNIDLDATAANSLGLVFYENANITTEDGDITVTATSSASHDIYSAGPSPTNTLSSTNGNVTINADTVVLENMSSISAGDTLSLFTLDPTTTIGLDGGTGIFNLNIVELAILNAGNKIVIGKDGEQTGDIDINGWDISSRSFDLELYANDINMGGIEMGAGSILAHAQDNGGDLGTLTIDGDIDRDMIDGTATLDLRADENILSSGGYSITATDADSDGDGDEETDADSLTVILNANRDGVVGNDEGGVDFNSFGITTLGGDIIIGGGTAPQNTPTYNLRSVNINNGWFRTNAGNIYISGAGNTGSITYDRGITLSGSSGLITTSGDIDITGTSRSTGTGSQGVGLYAVNLVTESGNITVTGEAQGNNTGNEGVYIGSDAGITSTGTGPGTGNITITGTGPGDQAEAVKIEGTDDITTKDANITITGINGDISIDNPISKVGGTEEIAVTIQADGNISLTSDGDITSSSGIMNVVLNADRDADEDGKISLNNADITTLGGYFVAGGGSGDVGGADGILGNGDGNGADDSYAYAVGSGHGLYIASSEIATAGGMVVLKGYAKDPGASRGILMYNSSIASDEGKVSMTGRTTGDTNDRGIEFNGNSGTVTTSVQTTSGDIDIYGVSSSTLGILFWEDTTISTTDGNITLTAIATSGNSLYSNGTTPNQNISSTNGNITLNINDASIDNMTTISAGDTLSIQTASNNTSIGLGNGAAGTLNLNAAELAVLSAGNRIVIGDSNNTGAVHVNNADLTGETLALYGGAMTIDGGLDADALSLISKGNITLNGAVTATDTGNSIIMKGTGFANTAGANAIDAGAGRYLVYMDTPSSVSKGGLTAKNLYNRTYSGHPPSSIAPSWGDRFVFAYQPTLTFTPNNQSLNTYNPSYNTFPYTVSGMVPGDSLADIFSGLPSFSKQETQSGTYRINGTNGSLTSLLGYKFAFAPGTLHMPRPVQQIGSSAGQQLQAPDRWLTQHSGYKIEYTNTASTQNTDTSQVTVRRNNLQQNIAKSAEQHADVRLVEADFMEINQPVIDFYDLCSYNVAYCQ